MQENKDLVKEALIQMKNVEEAIAENAKGILQSTMKEEISQLVKESLSEQDDEDEVDAEVEMDVEDEMSDDDMDTDNEDEMDMELDMDMDSEEDSPIDLTGASDEEILRVFKAMGEEDGIIVKKDGDDVHLKDNDADVEYLVKLGESEEDKIEETMNMEEEMDDQKTQDVIDAIFQGDSSGLDFEEDEVMYEIEFNEDDSNDGADEAGEEDESMVDESEDEDMMEEDEDEDMMESEDEDMMESEDEDMMEEDEDEDMMESEDEDMMEEDEDEDMMEEQNWEESLDEAYNHKKAKKSETKEGKMTVKPKGMGIGTAKKFKYPKTVNQDGFDEKKKEGPKSVGTGSVKKAKSFPKGENTNGKAKVVKKAETKEAARTYAMGSKEGRGLRKGITPNRDFVYTGKGVKKESVDAEVNMLREKNEEYRKALNVFREKLNEVAIFNSNLAYATRLFTEHSTTKKEKINILRRFDDVETLKESKSLYKSIKDELSNSETKSINESVEKKIVNTVSSGSAPTLIESKTYENPQFLRMKDLMSKLG